MPIKVTCSNCGGVLHAPDDAGGKRGRCPTCGNILPIPAITGGAASPPPAAAEPPRPAPARQSFGDKVFGEKVSATPPRVADPAPRPAAEPRRQSVPLPPPEDDPPAKKPKPTSPFTKPGAAPEATDGTVRAWKKARGGLWWVRLAVWLFLIPIIGLNGLRLYEHFSGKELPFEGVLHMESLPPAQELDLALLGAPVALALLCLVFGRLGFSSVPRKSGARGQALFAALGTLVALGGLIALLFPPVAAIATGEQPVLVSRGEWQLFLMGDTLALIQRFGVMIGIAGLLVAEFWFVGALGRAATALESPRFGGRVTRFTLLLGFVAMALLGTGVVRPATTEGERARTGALVRPALKAQEPEQAPQPRDEQEPKDKKPKEKKGKEKKGKEGGPMAPPEILPTGPAVPLEPYAVPEFDFNASVKRTGEEVQAVVQKEYVAGLKQLLPADFAHWPAVRSGAFLLGGLVVGLMYWRMVGAGRRAIREWLDQHQPT